MNDGIARPNRFDRPWIKFSLAIVILAIGVGISLKFRSSLRVIEPVKPMPQNLVYIQGGSTPDDEVGYRPKPCTWSRQFYSDNPRGFFHEASLQERLFIDWKIQPSEEVELCVVPSERTFPLKMKITSTQSNLPAWKAALRHTPITVPAEANAQLVLKGFAKSPRKVHVLFWPEGDWNHPYSSHEVIFSSERKEHVIDFPKSKFDARIIAGIDLGAQPGEFELDELRIQGIDPLGRSTEKQFFVDNIFNHWGYRDKNWTVKPAEGTIRVACIGDSFTFAQGVKQNARFTEVLESILNTNESGMERFEVMNFGLCGYSTNEELHALQKDVFRFAPKIVVLTMCWNDSIFFKREAELNEKLKGRPEEFSKEYSRIVKEEEFRNCIPLIEKMNSACIEQGCRFVVGIFNNADSEEWKLLASTILPAMKERGIPAFDIREELIAGNCFGLQSSVHETDHHPNEKAHAIYGQKLANVLKTEVFK
jgi:lysophospholipase L1-like esterase